MQYIPDMQAYHGQQQIKYLVHLAHLKDRLFELQTHTDAQRWPERFLAAIRPGADLSQVWPQWVVWMLIDPEHGVIRHAKRDATRKAIERVAQFWRDGGTPEEFKDARKQATAAAAAAADDADAYYADDDADAAYYAAAASDYAVAADYAAAFAASAAVCADSAAASAATWRKAQSQWAAVACDKLIALLEAT